MAFNGLGSYTIAPWIEGQPPPSIVVGVARNNGADFGAQIVTADPGRSEGWLAMSNQMKALGTIANYDFSPPLGGVATTYWATVTNALWPGYYGERQISRRCNL